METKEYQAFVDKFKPKKTTDDCYTPPYIYDAVLNWATKEYGIQGRPVVRPFYPGGDYENFSYPENCVVIDNPPFSILSKIISFYIEKKIDFFVFAPTLTLFSTIGRKPANAVIAGLSVVYENGAKVNTSYLTNLGDYKIHVSSELYNAVDSVQRARRAESKRTVGCYQYPDNLITAATLGG